MFMKKEILRKIFIKSIALAFCICFTFLSHAQTNTKTNTQSPDVNINLNVYHQSIFLGDYTTAINAVHYIIASDPVKNANWQDTLALLYLQSSAFQQAYIIASGLESSGGYSPLRTEIKAIAAKNLQQPIEAITNYSLLFSKTKNPSYGFEQLQLEYSIRRVAETINTGNNLLQLLPPNDSSKVTVVKLDGKTAQQVTLKAAIENIMGLAYIDLKNKANAVAILQAALKENPDFEQAKNNLSVANALGDEKKP